MTDDETRTGPLAGREEKASTTRSLEKRLVSLVKEHEGVTRRAFLGGLAVAGSAAVAGMGTAQSDDEEEQDDAVMYATDLLVVL